MNRFFSRFISVSLVLYFVFLEVFTVYACGVAVKLGGSGREVAWDYGDDSAENSYIKYSNGIENLILTRKFEQSESGIAWVIPIPADPTLIKLDVLDKTPRFAGEDVMDSADKSIGELSALTTLTQIWTVPFWFTYMVLSTPFVGAAPRASFGGAPGSIGGIAPAEQDVEVYTTVSKGGITSEVITAKTSKGIYDYLALKGLQIPTGSLSVLDGYIGGTYSFVTSWVEPTDVMAQTTQGYKGVDISFPTNQIFYPLHPGSVYEGPGMPETIYVVGHVTPRLYKDIKDKTVVNYYTNRSSDVFTIEEPTSTSWDYPDEYTKIVVNAKPSLLTEDLLIAPNTPIIVSMANTILYDKWMVAIILIVVNSAIAGIVPGRFAFGLGAFRENWIKYAIVGSFNIFTVLGVALVSRSVFNNHRMRFVLAFSTLFLATTLFTMFVVKTILAFV